MTKKIQLGDSEAPFGDDGMVVFSFQNVDIPFDIIRWDTKLTEFWTANNKKPTGEYYDLLVETIAESGLPKVSHGVAYEFFRLIKKLAKDLLEKKNRSLGLPVFTDSGPAPEAPTAA